MRIIVCAKPVPDPKYWRHLRVDPNTKTLMREGIPHAINPLDKKAIEAALQLRERKGGEVVLLSMAAPSAASVLREALAMGADRGVLLSDIRFAGSDTLATAYIMSAAIEKMAPYDLILCGNETSDGGTGHVSAQLAEFLHIPNLMHVSAIESFQGDVFCIRSQVEHGYMRVEVKSPVIFSVAKEINKPRYITLMNILESENKEIQTWSSKDLALEQPWVGLEGSPSQMADLVIVETKRKGELLQGEPVIIAETLAARLHRYGYC